MKHYKSVDFLSKFRMSRPLSHTIRKGRLHQIIRIKWALACKNFHTGSSCFTVDFCLAVRICVSLSHLWDCSQVLT